MGKCTFNEAWLKKKDPNGYIISEWARKKNEREVSCLVCTKDFNITWGFEAINQHAKTDSHKAGCQKTLSSSQLHISSVPCPISENDNEELDSKVNKVCTIQLTSNREKAARAELIWVIKSITADFPMTSSCDNIANTLKFMFPDAVPDDFSLSRTKAHYLSTEALAPYFKKMLLKDVDTSYFTLCYDDTTNAASYKQLQIAIRYWSSSKNKVCTRHLETFFLGSATAKNLIKKIDETLDENQLSRSRLLMLSNDGPNVNKAVTNMMNDYLVLSGRKCMIDIGTCSIHTVHNAFRKGMLELGEDASELIFLMYGFFDGWPSRWSDFEKLQSELKVKNHRFIKHVPSRWLTVEASASRILEQWPVIIKYFKDFVPKYKTQVSGSTKYKSIMSFLNDKTLKAEILFLIMSAKLFTKFTAFFQREEPLVHILYTELEKLTKTLMNRICDSSAPLSLKSICSEKFLPLSGIVMDAPIKDEMSCFSENERKIFLTYARKHFAAAATHLLENSVLNKPLLKSLNCLSPLQSVKANSHTDIVKVAEALPMNIPLALLADEWKLLSSFEKETSNKQTSSLEDYWNSIFQLKNNSGDPKYPIVTQVVKAAISLSHGSADVERGFSTSGRILTDIRASMNEKTLSAYLTIKEAVKIDYENRVDFVKIDNKLLEMARKAHSSYKQYCVEQKRKKEEQNKEKELKEKEKEKELQTLRTIEKTHSKIQEQEETLQSLREDEEEKRKVVCTLLSNATETIKQAAESKDLTRLTVAKIMLEGVEQAFNDETNSKKQADAVQRTINKRKKSLITSFFNKKAKKE